MAPPAYSDLGKSARNIFSSGYNFNVIKLDLKTVTESGVEFNSGGQSNQDSGKVTGNLETRYKLGKYGLTFTEKWSTDNVITTEVALADKLLKGLKLSADCTFAPQTGSRSGRVKADYKHDLFALNTETKLGASGALLNASAVVGYQNLLVGYQSEFDFSRNKITRNNVALGFTANDFTIHTNCNDGQEFAGNIYHKVSPILETGIHLDWSSGSNNTRFGIGCKYDLENQASLRAKVNNQSQIGLSYQQKLRDGITLTLSALIDGKNFNSGGHKVGAALEINA